LEKPAYAILSSFVLLQYLFLSQPVTEVVLYEFKSPIITALSVLFFLIGEVMIFYTLFDMINCDLFGFCYYLDFKKEGTEFPRPFVMKNMSRLGLSCRHPLDSGFYVMYAATLFYGQVTVGRVFFVLVFLIGVTIGNHFEEKEIYKVAAK